LEVGKMQQNQWPADKVERRSITSLRPYAANARTHSAEQIEQLANSIREWGWTMPVLVDENETLIAGHARIEAAALLGIGEVPVMVARGWSRDQVRAYVIADNKLAMNAGWSTDLLIQEVGELQASAFDVSRLGFSEAELAALMDRGTDGRTDPDDVPEPPVEPLTRRGDLWQLGRHRLMCGDATRAPDVALCLAGARPHLMVTDPPYGVEYDATWRGKALRDGAKRAVGVVRNDATDDWRAAWAFFPGDVAYVWASGRRLPESITSLEAVGFERRCLIVWAKSSLVLGRGHYHSQEEECWYAVRRGGESHWQGDRSQTTLWQIGHRVSETGHSTQKPVECMKRPMVNNSVPGEMVYDPFVGSGTSVIAAEMTGRVCYAMEINPEHCDCTVLRWQNFTGQTATKEGR
jgi:DNA modification methylase